MYNIWKNVVRNARGQSWFLLAQGIFDMQAIVIKHSIIVIIDPQSYMGFGCFFR